MPLWRLTPTDSSNRNWQFSSHKGPVVVRAPDADMAKKAAARVFGAGSEQAIADGEGEVPWLRRGLVEVDEIADDRFTVHGEVEILDPPGHKLDLKGEKL